MLTEQTRLPTGPSPQPWPFIFFSARLKGETVAHQQVGVNERDFNPHFLTHTAKCFSKIGS